MKIFIQKLKCNRKTLKGEITKKKKVAKQQRKEQHLPDTSLQTAVDSRKTWKC